MPTTTSLPHRMSGWDRAAIATLGGAGCALSYDALQQMAGAIHVRGPLTYLFPLVIDGFIAYGVRALILTRTAPFRARLYVWTLFGIATTASLWANALHAVRLNQEPATADGLRLDDTTVGILSTLAPLALAGAVHLYLIVARHDAGSPRADRRDSDVGRDRFDPLACSATGHPQPAESFRRPEEQPGTANPVSSDLVPENGRASARRSGRPPSAQLHELMAIARPVVRASGTVSRKAVLEAIRNSGHTVSNDRLREVVRSLATEATAQKDTTGSTR